MKVKRLFAIAAFTMLAVGVKAEELTDVKPVGFIPDASPGVSTQLEVCNTDLKPMLRVHDLSELKLPTNPARTNTKGVQITPQSIAGSYVTTYNTMLSSGYNGGGNSYIAVDGDNDTITIRGFYSIYPVKAIINREQGTVSIPRQMMFDDETLGHIAITSVTSSGVVDPDANIVGTVLEDGRIDFRYSYWALVPTDGLYADNLIEAYGNYMLTPPTGRMEFTSVNGEASYPVLVEQTSPNVLKVTNFYNSGLTMEFILNTDRTATIQSQTVMINSYGSWSTAKCVKVNDYGQLVSYDPDIITDQNEPDNNTTITWDNWTVMTTGYYAGVFNTGKLTAFTPFTFPTLENVVIEGEGTEDDPYRVSSLEHLLLIADNVNTDSNYTAVDSNGNKYAPAYKGKYFELTCDIDMDSYRFVPIAAYSNHRFAGTFDGKGHSIKNLNVKGATRYFSGLFGVCDGNSTLKNIVLENPTVTSAYYYAAGLVASSEGVIENITVKNPTISNTGTVIAAGVVGVSGNTVKNCKVVGGKLQSYGYSGSIAGEAHSSLINCYADGTQLICYGTNPVGGVVGNLYYATASNCYFSGKIISGLDGTKVFGGIAGNVGAGTVETSFFVGEIDGTSNAMAGGIAGRLQGTIRDCYSIGNINCSSSMTGGLVGSVLSYTVNGVANNSEIKNSYTSSYVGVSMSKKVTDSTPEIIGYIDSGTSPVIENIYFDNQVLNLGSKKYGVATSDLTAANGPAGFDSTKWLFTEGYYPRLKGMENEDAAKYGAATVTLPEGNSYRKVSKNAVLRAFEGTTFKLYANSQLLDETNNCKIADGQLIIAGDSFGTDTLCVINNNSGMQLLYPVSITPVYWEGLGTADSPYLIKTKDDLIELGATTSLYNQMFLGSYFEMVNDIDMEHDTTFTPINCYSADYGFSANFDAKNHTIHNMTIKAIVWTKEPTDDSFGVVSMSYSRKYVGLFGYIGKDGVVKNLNMAADCDFSEIYGESGVIAALNNGLIENCRNYANIKGYGSDIGGIAGLNGYNNSNARIVNCYNAGNVTSGLDGSGGIAGANYAKIVGCVNTGDIASIKISDTFASTPYDAGGISGLSYGAAFEDCINYGTVSADSHYVGGISGRMSSTGQSGPYGNLMSRCVNVGSVISPKIANVGAISGACTTLKHANSYFDAQIIGLKAIGLNNATGINGVETAELTSGTALDGLGTDVWTFTAGLYPTLKSFEAEPKVVAMRKAPMSIPTGYTTSDMRTNATLSGDYTWRIALAEVFTLDGLTLKGPATVETLVTDTIYATNSLGLVRPIIIKAAPLNPLSGNGTVESPYLIKSVEEWNQMTAYINAVSDDMLERYFKITDDLDFTDKDCSRLGNNGVVIFNGTLDGDNHTMKGLALEMLASKTGAVIGTVGKYGTVKNLTLEGTQTGTRTYTTSLVDNLYGKLDNIVCNVAVESNSGFTSGVVGRAYAGSSMNKVVNKGNVISTGTYIGGIVAFLEAGVQMNDCGNEGRIFYNKQTANCHVGGLVAQAKGASMVRCYNKGVVGTSNYTTCGAVGGLIADASAANVVYDLVECWNEGTITASHKIGGLIGDVSTSTVIINMISCYNSGTINAKGNKNVSNSPIAGLTTLYTPGSVFDNCWNEGEINGNKIMYSAGIAGRMAKDIPVTNPAIFRNCFNKGLVEGKGTVTGGIVAIVSGAVNIEDCYNSGTVDGSQIVGGIIGSLEGDSPTITRCYNTGTVTGTQSCVGGLIGSSPSTNGYISLSWNKGSVSTSSMVKSSDATAGCSIGGLAGAAASTFADCFNAGPVSGMLNVGGLIGLPTVNVTSIFQAYNTGTVSADADACGAILGNVDAANWSSENQLSNIYYLSSSVNSEITTKGKAMTLAELAKQKIGNNWTSADDYSLPIPTVFNDNDEALVHSASVILREEDTYDKVTRTFYIGTPDGVAWTASNENVLISGNRVWLKGIGDVALTASRGDCSKTIQLYIGASGVEGLDADNEIDHIDYYTTSGLRVMNPEVNDGNIYIVVITYKDGSTRRHRQVNR